MSGEKNLNILLSHLSPELCPGEFVFCSFPGDKAGTTANADIGLEPIASIVESEGLSLVITRTKADEHGIAYESTYRRITLKVHSSLDAVGLTAAFSSTLAEHGISANVISGYYHDHIFVPTDHAQVALEALQQMTHKASEC